MAFHRGPKIVTDGLIAYFDAANPKSYPGTGVTWKDLSGQGNDGTLVNGVGYSTDNQGSLNFDGSNDYVSTNLIYNLPLSSTEFSCSCWFKCGVQSTNTVLISNYNNKPIPFNLNVLTNGTVTGTTRNAASQLIVLGTTNSYDDSKYHNVFYIKDSSNNYYLYVDGILQNSGNTNLGAINPNTTIWIGTLRLFNQGYFNGNIPQVSIYNRALTSDEVLQNYNALKGRFKI